MEQPTNKHNAQMLVGVIVAIAVVVAIWSAWRIDHRPARQPLGPAYQYDVTSLAYIDPNRIQYSLQMPLIETGYTQAHGLWVDTRGQVWVAGDQTVRVFQRDGNIIRTLLSPGPSRCVTVTDAGQVYVGKSDHVDVFDGEGALTSSWAPLATGALITSIAAVGDTVYVADAGHRRVVVYDQAGQVTRQIGAANEAQGFAGFVVPSPYFDLAPARDGLLRVVNPGRLRVDAFTLDGTYEFSWGASSNALEDFCGCCNPTALAVLPDGSFITAEKGLMRVKEYNSDGAFVGVVAGPAQLAVSMEPKVCQSPQECQAGGLDVAVDASGQVYVLDTRQGQVRVFKKTTSDL